MIEDQVDYTDPVEKFEAMLTQEQVDTMIFQDLITILDILELVKERIMETPEQDDLGERMNVLTERVQNKINEQFDTDT